MSDKNYNLVFTGEFIEGIDKEIIFEKLAETFKTDVAKIKNLFSNGRAVIKKNADKQTCIKMQEAVLFAGAQCEIERIPSENDGEEFVISEEPEPEPAKQEETQEDTSSNPYAAPTANIETEKTSENDFIGPQKRPGSHGGSWVFQAFSLFFKSPMMWIAIMFVFLLISIVGNIIPIIGAIVMALLNPVFMGGMLKGAKELDEEDNLNFGCLFYGFKENFGQLVLLGLLMFIAMLILVAVIVGGTFLTMGSAFSSSAPFGGLSPSIFMIMILLVFALVIPLIMFYWFAPALICINGFSVTDAMKMSFNACMKNIIPFLLYGLVFMGIMLVVFIIIGIFSAILTAVIGSDNIGAMMVIPMIIMFIVWISILPVTFSSNYTSYKDIFYKN